jgi:hypothetical protein
MSNHKVHLIRSPLLTGLASHIHPSSSFLLPRYSFFMCNSDEYDNLSRFFGEHKLNVLNQKENVWLLPFSHIISPIGLYHIMTCQWYGALD